MRPRGLRAKAGAHGRGRGRGGASSGADAASAARGADAQPPASAPTRESQAAVSTRPGLGQLRAPRASSPAGREATWAVRRGLPPTGATYFVSGDWEEVSGQSSFPVTRWWL